VLGGSANIAVTYATKRYRSNLINWGMIPFLADKNDFTLGELVYIPSVKEKLLRGDTEYPAIVYGESGSRKITLRVDELTPDEKDIIVKGCLINYYASK
jgi:aconitate hydratase